MRSVTGFFNLLALLLSLMSCSRREFIFITPQGDTLQPLVSIGKIKAKTVTLQIGGSQNQQSAADNTKAGQRQGSAATAPAAVASNASTKSSGPRWWVYLAAAVVGAVGWEWFRGKIPLKWLAPLSGPP